MVRLVIRIAIIGLIALGALVFRDRMSGGAADLAVGDCFDEPTILGEVNTVQHHPCNEPHTSEVVFVGDMPASETYPSDEAFMAFFNASCVQAFNTYTGLDFAVLEAVDMGILTPTTKGWSGGDREVICYAIRVDGTAVSQSFKAAR
ncbi:MAG TPA: septum formation family protein [Candidatus Limnocylindrales bacterium]|nr:septum formation family protein [Candidatus Limnocylindrales bacterium]